MCRVYDRRGATSRNIVTVVGGQALACLEQKRAGKITKQQPARERKKKRRIGVEKKNTGVRAQRETGEERQA